jgi:hypothetical protein
MELFMRLPILAVLAALVPVTAFAADLPSGHPAVAPGQPAPAAEVTALHAGKATEVLPAGTYVYVHVKTAQGEEWIAGPSTDIKVGDNVRWNEGGVMRNWPSKTLNRTFESLRLVETLKVEK